LGGAGGDKMKKSFEIISVDNTTIDTCQYGGANPLGHACKREGIRQCLHVGSVGKHRKPLTSDGCGGFGASGSGNNICGHHSRASTVIILRALW